MRFVLIFILLATSCSLKGQNKLQTIIREQQIPKSELTIVIDKSDFTLSVWHKDIALIYYPCVFGFNPVDDKQQGGDGCTPEGEFVIRAMYPHRNWKYFIWIDYPNKESWRKFNTRKTDGTIDAAATIGGEIGIHGVPAGSDHLIASKTNWTLGCISLKNEDITDLYKSINTKTMIKIVK